VKDAMKSIYSQLAILHAWQGTQTYIARCMDDIDTGPPEATMGTTSYVNLLHPPRVYLMKLLPLQLVYL